MLTEALERALEAQGLTGRRLLVAVSGGLDSTVLLHGLVAVSARRPLDLVVGHVNHGLRGAESDEDARQVEALAEKLGLAFRGATIDPAALRVGGSNRARPTLQEAARQLRYEALSRMADECGADVIATAHHRDDQAETVLMRLLRGTGPSGLAGIPERSADGRVVRLLLGVGHEEIHAFASAQGLTWRDDSSNASDAYTRNRLRHHWLPALADEFNPQLGRALAGMAEAQRRDLEWMESLVDAVQADYLSETPGVAGMTLGRAGWGELPEALARRLVQRALTHMGCGRDATRVHIERVLAFVRGFDTRDCGSTLELPGGLRLTQRRDGYRLEHAPGAG